MSIYKNIFVITFCTLLVNTNLYPCIMIVAENDTLVLAGNNEDHDDPNTYVWFIDKDDGFIEEIGDRVYGCIYFGYSNLRPQGGMNEAGLCFDAFATVVNPVLNSGHLPLVTTHPMDLVMKNCSTVDEVVKVFSSYNLTIMNKFQLLFVDRNGDAVIIEGDEVIYKEDYYQVCTNFYHSNPELGGYPCWRYDTAVQMFETIRDSISISLFRDILDATHQDEQYPTLYTNIYDITNGDVYLYYNHQYGEVIKFNLETALKREDKEYRISMLFSDLLIKSPINGETIGSTSTILSWKGKGKYYEVYYSIDPQFKSFEKVQIDVSEFNKMAYIPIWLLFLGLFIFIKRINKAKLIVRSCVIISLLCIGDSCNINKATGPSEQSNIIIEQDMVNVTINNLKPNSTYYWYVRAMRYGPFYSKSAVNTFIIHDN